MCYPKAPKPTMRYALAQHVDCGEQVSKSANATECKTIPTVTPGAGVQETGNGRAPTLVVSCAHGVTAFATAFGFSLPQSVCERSGRATD